LPVATLLERDVFVLLDDEACGESSELPRRTDTLPRPVEPIGGGGGGSGSFVFAPMRARTSCSSSKRACSRDMDGDLVFDRGLAASKGTIVGIVGEAGRRARAVGGRADEDADDSLAGRWLLKRAKTVERGEREEEEVLLRGLWTFVWAGWQRTSGQRVSAAKPQISQSPVAR
jgi:hypothetical protein